jgi:nitric oxide dioxygenase
MVHHGPQQPIHFVQAATNSPRHAFHEELATLAHSCPLLTTHIRYSLPLAADRMEGRHHSEGMVDRAFLDSLIAKTPPDAEFYFCGPAPFMRVIAQHLHDHQIEETRIHFEFFGPKLQLTAA